MGTKREDMAKDDEFWQSTPWRCHDAGDREGKSRERSEGISAVPILENAHDRVGSNEGRT